MPKKKEKSVDLYTGSGGQPACAAGHHCTGPQDVYVLLKTHESGTETKSPATARLDTAPRYSPARLETSSATRLPRDAVRAGGGSGAGAGAGGGGEALQAAVLERRREESLRRETRSGLNRSPPNWSNHPTSGKLRYMTSRTWEHAAFSLFFFFLLLKIKFAEGKRVH